MVKLIVSDVDGTLLASGEKCLSENITNALTCAKDSGIKFAIASGRSYCSLAEIFDSIKDDVYFICHDGSVIIENSKLLYARPISMTDVLSIVRNDLYKDCGIVLGTPFCSYVIKNVPDLESHISGLHTDSVCFTQDLYKITEPICKISIFNSKCTPAPISFKPQMLRVCYNNFGWCEYVSSIANKGLAVSDLQMRLYLSKFDTVCLGDGENDIEMMKKAKLAISANVSCNLLENVCNMHTNNVAQTIMTIVAQNGE